MALPPLATVDALSDWVGGTISDPARAEAVLSAASALVRAEAGQTWVDAEGALTTVPDEVAVVVVQAAGRVWFNPAGLESATIDDATRRWPADQLGLYLTDSERSLLSRYRSSGAPNGLGVLSTTRGDECGTNTIYVPTGPPPPGYPLPWYDADDPAVP